MDGGADDAIGALSDDVLDLILIGDIKRDFSRTSLRRLILHHLRSVWNTDALAVENQGADRRERQHKRTKDESNSTGCVYKHGSTHDRQGRSSPDVPSSSFLLEEITVHADRQGSKRNKTLQNAHGALACSRACRCAIESPRLVTRIPALDNTESRVSRIILNCGGLAVGQ